MKTIMAPDRSNVRMPQSLRLRLREATAAQHDRLDTAMRPPEDWRSRGDYIRFLTAQYEARVPIEEWFGKVAPATLTPPEQSPLLAQDLEALGAEIPVQRFEFALAGQDTPGFIGAAWVLAGSSLGNRAMLHDMRRALPENDRWPAAFLGDTAMTEFWQALRPRIEEPCEFQDEEIAAHAAACVFDHFLTVARMTRPKVGTR